MIVVVFEESLVEESEEAIVVNREVVKLSVVVGVIASNQAVYPPSMLYTQV